jgi:hypothetical protein
LKLRARTSVVGTITASLAFALVGPAVAAHASAEASSAVSGAALARFPEFAGLTDSKSLKDPLMLQGTLTDTAGKALGGAQVLMAAWPSAEAVGKLPAGGSFDIIPMARTIAGKDGAYQLRSLLTPLLMGLSGKDGLDVELDVFHGGRHYVYLTQLQTTGGTWFHDFVRGVDGQAGELTSKATNALDLALDPADGEKLSKDLAQAPRFQAADHPVPGGVGCTHYEKVGKNKKAWTTVATAIARNGTTIKTTYSQGAKTVTSTGFSFDKGVTFAMSGAREHSASTTAHFFPEPSQLGGYTSRLYEAMVEHVVMYRECTGNRYGEYRPQHVTSPVWLTNDFRNIADEVHAPVPCQPKNIHEETGVADIATDKAKAYTYQHAFGFAPIRGSSFSGNALSGYSDQVKIQFVFASRNGMWCGHSGEPTKAGQMVQGFER